jgi:hypothetical protein
MLYGGGTWKIESVSIKSAINLEDRDIEERLYAKAVGKPEQVVEESKRTRVEGRAVSCKLVPQI